ncbi:hypothetical protein ACHQM5_031288 [Ranunculus cassubicifolius]
MGSPLARRREHAVAEARRKARAAHHDRGNDISVGVTTAQAWVASAIRVGPRAEPSGGPAFAVPHPADTHRRPPSASLPTISSTSLTLFSKSFSSFPRGTCSLSVSRQYLALDGIYRPIGGCIPKQPDSPTAPRGATGSGHDGALTLSGATFQGTWARSVAEDASTDYNSDDEAVRFPSWAFPGSLAVTRGILVSFFSSAY